MGGGEEGGGWDMVMEISKLEFGHVTLMCVCV